MGIQINGNTNNINAGIGSLSIDDIRELDITGVATASNFKTGVSNLHDVGLTLSGGQLDVGSNIKLGNAGVVTATSYRGDGSQLTGISAGTTINGNVNNRVLTATGNANEIDAEGNLTFGGDILAIQSTQQALGARFTNTGNEYTNLQFSAARTSANAALGIINAKWNNNHEVAAIYMSAGDDTTNKDNGQIRFYTSPDSGTGIQNRMTISPEGYVTKPNQPNFLTGGYSSQLSANNYNYIIINSAYFNVANCYNGSNGRFTAPVDGYYFFYGAYTGSNSVAGPVMGLHKNGGSHQGELLNYYCTYDGSTLQQVKYLSTGDYVNWSMRDWNSHTPHPWSTWWGGYLLH